MNSRRSGSRPSQPKGGTNCGSIPGKVAHAVLMRNDLITNQEIVGFLLVPAEAIPLVRAENGGCIVGRTGDSVWRTDRSDC